MPTGREVSHARADRAAPASPGMPELPRSRTMVPVRAMRVGFELRAFICHLRVHPAASIGGNRSSPSHQRNAHAGYFLLTSDCLSGCASQLYVNVAGHRTARARWPKTGILQIFG